MRTSALLVSCVGLIAALPGCGARAGASILAGAPRERDLPEPIVDEAQLRPDTFGYGAGGKALAIVGCDAPIEYALGALDPRFGLGRKQALRAIATAAASWARLAGRPLFRYSPRSAFKIDFVFDERQEMMVERIEGRDPIVEVRRRHTELRAERDRALFAYEERRRAYEASVATWNQQGGAPPDVKRELDAEKQRLRAEQARVDGMLPRLEALAFFINSRGRQADPADYPHLLAGRTRREASGTRVTKLRIEIYMFRGWARLPAVLAHELGHSLGMNHVAAADAIMYGGPAYGPETSADDATALARVCPPPR
ncbi:MAG: matrixin family metalloprotease [Myxococcales bacterium]|nr:matrixin family metalloprotease [Myxococcales bacterium]